MTRLRIRLGRLGTAAALLSCSLVVLGPRGAQMAGATGNFSAVASAAGLRVALTAAEAPVSSTVLDVGGPVSQARLDGLGSSGALAALPFPGDLVLAAPGLLNGARPSELPGVPDYPLAVRADHPVTPEASKDAGPNRIWARASERQAAAGTASGLSSADATAGAVGTDVSVHLADDGSVVATGTSAVQGLAIGPLRLAGVTSRAMTTRHLDGTLARSAQLGVEGVTVNGTSVGLGPKGFTVVGTDVPLPETSPILEPLRQAGLDVAYVAAQSIDDGVIAAGLTIVRAQEFGPAGPGKLTITVGQAVARIASGSGDGSSEPLAPPDFGPVAGERLSEPEPAPTSSGGSDASQPPAPAGSGEAALLALPPGPVASPFPASPQAAAPPAPVGGVVQPLTLSAAPPAPFDLSGIFGVIALGALLIFAGAQAIRSFAVRLPWRS